MNSSPRSDDHSMTSPVPAPPKEDVSGKEQEPHHGRHKRWRPHLHIRTYFLTGLVVAAPIIITGYLTYAFVTFVDGQVAALIPNNWAPWLKQPFAVPGLGVVAVFIGLVLLGALTANVFGRWIIESGERAVERMPVIRNVYRALKQIFETVLAQSDQSFRQVGLIEYPRPGLWAVVFIAGPTRGEIQERNSHELLSVFLPTTPNPTSGYLLFVPRKDVVILDMTVEEGAKLVISGGLVAPPFPATPDEKGAGKPPLPGRPAAAAASESSVSSG